MRLIIISLFAIFVSLTAFAAPADLQWVAVQTPDKHERTRLVNLGVPIEQIVDDTSYAFVTNEMLQEIRKRKFTIKSTLPVSKFRSFDFPPEDAVYHNYAEMTAALQQLAADFPDLINLFSIGESLEGRNIWALRFNPTAENGTSSSGKPGIVFMGGHHAREHLSMEIPLLLARHLAENFNRDDTITRLLNARDVFIIPVVNPDGSEHDIETGSYRWWRKNLADNEGHRCKGVDLNRNYSFMWGTGGSSRNPCSDTHMGPTPFSEPETVAVKNFVEARPNLKILLSFHTYSELILYPWGHKYDAIEVARDREAYETMARTMSDWNGYTPQQSSDLYIASGDTTDWAYGELGLFAFTFELSPSRWGGGGFYPGPDVIEPTFRANLRPVLYLIDLADNPYRANERPEATLFFGI